ncbi:MAG: hypothetical protein MUE46_13815 [Xanthomonadales bacterium]|jgi:hypothetical protein|nr:hypothetical protein [Xanthomonadales bacterium]
MKKPPHSDAEDPFLRWEARIDAWLADPRLARLAEWGTEPRLRQLLYGSLGLLGLSVLLMAGRLGGATLPLLATLAGIGVGIARGYRPTLYLNLIVTAIAALTLPFLLTLGAMYTDREQVGSFNAGVGGFTILLMMLSLAINGLSSAALLWLTRYHAE